MNISNNFIDLQKDTVEEPINCEFCIVGAGAIGIYIANQLSGMGYVTVLLDSGPNSGISTESAGFCPDFENEIYKGATLGRFFGLGGSTTRWGGALIPHNSNDLIGIGESTSVWEYILKTVNSNASTVLKNLGYADESNFEDKPNEYLGEYGQILNKQGLNLNSNLYLPFKKKNFTNQLCKSSFLRVIYNATVTDWLLKDEVELNRIIKISAFSKNKNKLSVFAKKTIITAGAIESTRILLEINQKYNNRIFSKSSDLGHFLSDHLSLTIADVENTHHSINSAIKLFAPRFDKSWMRGIRFIDNESNLKNARGFAHFIFSMESSGFNVLKSILTSIQRREIPTLNIKELLNSPQDLYKLILTRYKDSRLYISPDLPIKFQLDVEQIPERNNSIKLSNELDIFGRSKILINWRISDDDLKQIESRAKSILDKWPSMHKEFPTLIPRMIDFENNKPHDAYHPVGTIRMGVDSQSTVDLNHKVNGIDNLWVISTGNLPSAGTANPTFTLLCLAQNLVDTFARLKMN
jgi:hypothetical protein